MGRKSTSLMMSKSDELVNVRTLRQRVETVKPAETRLTRTFTISVPTNELLKQKADELGWDKSNLLERAFLDWFDAFNSSKESNEARTDYVVL